MLEVDPPQSGLRPACKDCGGTGRRMECEDDANGAVRMVMRDDPCPTCKGTGTQ